MKVILTIFLILSMFHRSVTSFLGEVDGDMTVIKQKQRLESEHSLDPFAFINWTIRSVSAASIDKRMKSRWHLIVATSFSMVATLIFQCRFSGTQADLSLYQLHVADMLHEGILSVRSCILYSKSNTHLTISTDWKRAHLFRFWKMLWSHVRFTPHCHAMPGYLFLLTDAHRVIRWCSHVEMYASCVVHVPYRVILSSILWWRCHVLFCGHNYRSSPRLAGSEFDVRVANAWTSMVLIIASSRFHLCPASVRGFLLIRVLDWISIRAISSGFRLVSLHLRYVKHSLLQSLDRERNWI